MTCAFVLISSICVFLLIRTTQVCRFGEDIIDKACDFPIDDHYEENMAFAESIIYKHSYNEMLFSFKPLKLEYWFDENEIFFLTEIHK